LSKPSMTSYGGSFVIFDPVLAQRPIKPVNEPLIILNIASTGLKRLLKEEWFRAIAKLTRH